jgi:hypothetical protein
MFSAALKAGLGACGLYAIFATAFTILWVDNAPKRDGKVQQTVSDDRACLVGLGWVLVTTSAAGAAAYGHKLNTGG